MIIYSTYSVFIFFSAEVKKAQEIAAWNFVDELFNDLSLVKEQLRFFVCRFVDRLDADKFARLGALQAHINSGEPDKNLRS